MLIIDPVSEPVMKKVAVFIGKSLLAQGALSYFKEYLANDVDVRSLSVFNPKEALEQLKSCKPDIVIVEAQCLLMDPSFSQSAILELFPALVMLELRIDSPEVQVIRSECRQPASFEELARVLGLYQPQAAPFPAQQVYSHV